MFSEVFGVFGGSRGFSEVLGRFRGLLGVLGGPRSLPKGSQTSPEIFDFSCFDDDFGRFSKVTGAFGVCFLGVLPSWVVGVASSSYILGLPISVTCSGVAEHGRLTMVHVRSCMCM